VTTVPASDEASPLLVRLAQLCGQLRNGLQRSPETAQTFAVLAAAVPRAVPACEWASLTLRQGARTWTAGSSSDVAAALDGVQYAVQQGPCLEAIDDGEVMELPDTADERRWPQFTRRARQEHGMGSSLSMPLRVDEGSVVTAASVNLYATRPHAFTAGDVAVAGLVAAYAGAELSAALHRQRVRNLEEALSTNRDIGAAVGVLMALAKITREEAIAELRRVSQDTNRKLRDVAADVLETGTLEHPPRRGAAPRSLPPPR
jgi:GAF domain-containing protein